MATRRLLITLDGRTFGASVGAASDDGRRAVELDGDDGVVSARVRVLATGPNPLVLVDDRVVRWAASSDGNERALSRGGTTKTARVGGAEARARTDANGGGGSVRAPMPGRVVHVAVAAGDQVTSGTLVLVIEAMKMQNELFAAGTGRVEAVLVRAGDTVERGAELVRIA